MTVHAGIGEAVDALMTYFQAGTNMADKLVEVDALRGGGITLKAPGFFSQDVPDITMIAQWPAIVILPGDGATTIPSSDGNRESLYDVEISILIMDARYQELSRRVTRYLEAIKSLVMDAYTTGALAGWLPIGSFQDSPHETLAPVETGRAEFLTGGTTAFQLSKQEAAV